MASSIRGALMSADRHYDVIIIGTGAGGGTLTYRLAPSGKKILLLERGGFVPREKQNWDSRAVARHKRKRIRAWSTLLRRRQYEVLWRSARPAAQAGFWRNAPPQRYFAGLAVELRRLGAVLHRGRVFISSARHPWRRSDRASRQQTISISAGQSRVADPATE